MAVWLVTAVAFAALLALAQASGSALDDPDPARQRPGFLDGVPCSNPPPASPPLCPGPAGRRWPSSSARTASAGCASPCPVIPWGSGPTWPWWCRERASAPSHDGRRPAARLARAYGLHRPRSGGAPVGYAVVDRHGRIRYRTLDPTVADHLGEVRTIVGAVE